jgi:DNA-binding NtrC family response regulator
MAHASGEVRAPALIGTSPRIVAVLAEIERVAETDAPLLVTGEPGTGKFQVAEMVHRSSRRSGGPFVVCTVVAGGSPSLDAELFGRTRVSAAPESMGAFARAHRGTLFLEDLGNMEKPLQHALLETLERRDAPPWGAALGRATDVRIVASSNRELEDEVRAGRFDGALYRRVAALRIRLPPLRERREDIPLLVDFLLGELSVSYDRKDLRLSADGMDALCRCDWPENVRELRGVLERAVIRSENGLIASTALGLDPTKQRSGILLTRSWQPFKEAKEQLLEEWETEYLRAVLERSRGNIALAARYAGLARGHVYRLLKKHNL